MAFQRKGTVIRHDGPVHALSYALKDIQVQYIPPISIGQNVAAFPLGWKKPDMPHAAKFKYDFSLENQIIEQAQVKALSQARKVTREELQRPRLPQLDSTILTPVQASSSPSTTTSTTTTTTTTADQSGGSRSATLGEMSLRDFEGDSSDPFEAASLQAINDMELLQTVVISHTAQPPLLPQPRGDAATTGTTPQPLGLSQTLGLSQPVVGVASQTNLGQLNVTHPQTNLGQLNVTHPQSNTTTIQSPLYGTLPLVHPTKRQLPHPLRGSSSEEPTPIYTSVPSVPVGGSVPSVPLGGSVPLGPIASVGQVPTSGMSSGPVGGVAIGNLTPAGSGAVRGVGGAFPNREMEGVLPMMSQMDMTAASSLVPPTVSARPLGPIAGPPSFPVPSPPLATPLSSSSSAPPPLHAKPARPPRAGGVVPSTTAAPPTNHTPVTLPTQPAVGVLVHDGVTPPFGRPGLGVAVLPPIGMSRPLSPYISPVVMAPLPSVQPPPPPSFRLVDPRANLSPEQKVELDSLVAMGFPPPRVARALLRSGDKSKALDVLVQIGNLEEKGYYGDSAEQALISTQNEAEALNYLGKVEQYKGIGFTESSIHEAYVSAGGNWDKALDLLTQGSV